MVDVMVYFREVRGLDAREVCLFDTYGPDDDRGKLVTALLDHAARGTTAPMSSGRQLIDLTYVDDVVAAFRQVADHEGPVERLVARTYHPIAVRDLVALVEGATGRQLRAEWGARPDRPREMLSDWSVPTDDIGWRAHVPLLEGLRRTWAAGWSDE
jgi:nucleoside-diphosphate-sugar epimerase